MIKITSKTRLPFEELGSSNFPDPQQNNGNRSLLMIGCARRKKYFRFILLSCSTSLAPNQPSTRSKPLVDRQTSRARSPRSFPGRSSSADRARLAPIVKGAFARVCDHFRMNLGCKIIDSLCKVLSELDLEIFNSKQLLPYSSPLWFCPFSGVFCSYLF